MTTANRQVIPATDGWFFCDLLTDEFGRAYGARYTPIIGWAFIDKRGGVWPTPIALGFNPLDGETRFMKSPDGSLFSEDGVECKSEREMIEALERDRQYE